MLKVFSLLERFLRKTWFDRRWGINLIASNGKTWRKHKRVMGPSFIRTEIFLMFLSSIDIDILDIQVSNDLEGNFEHVPRNAICGSLGWQARDLLSNHLPSRYGFCTMNLNFNPSSYDADGPLNHWETRFRFLFHLAWASWVCRWQNGHSTLLSIPL